VHSTCSVLVFSYYTQKHIANEATNSAHTYIPLLAKLINIKNIKLH